MNGCYKVVSENLDLDASTAKCRSFHQAAHLVMLENLAENAAVGQVVDSVDSKCTLRGLCVLFRIDRPRYTYCIFLDGTVEGNFHMLVFTIRPMHKALDRL